MSEPPPSLSIDDASLDDPRIRDAIRQYQDRIEAGERPDRAAFLAQHADIASVLVECLEGLDFVHGFLGAAGSSQAVSGVMPLDTVQPGKPLGDYQLLREIGRGGMGVVYEAVQVSLGRRVAVKILPFAAALDSRQLQRFRNEAQAAAQLHHPHIVPVHGLGTDRGVHYYAMQFIEGCTLADVIARLRQERKAPSGRGGSEDAYARARERQGDHAPACDEIRLPAVAFHSSLACSGAEFFRAAARLAIQAADALEHAHQLGIIHRDVKPANLLLTLDNHLWITDFGLARYRSEQELTHSGDVVGTLRYMSPEQSLARHGLVDHRTDIYSLGTTIYELLALQPAFAGRDREEILRQMASEDAPPLRRVNSAVPVALETILCKAMAHELEGRYTTAAEMADDLRRFLGDRPILARRPTVRERAAKYAWRHRRMLSAVAVMLGITILGLVIALSAIWHEKEQTRGAYVEAEQQRQRAENNFEKALAGVDQLLWALEDPRWAGMPEIPKLRQALTEKALRWLKDDFVRTGSTDPAVRAETGSVYMLLAGIHCEQKQVAPAFDLLDKAVDEFAGLVSDYPTDLRYRKLLGSAYCFRGTLHFSSKESPQAEEDFHRALIQYRHLMSSEEGGDLRNKVAWLLADCPMAGVRKPSEAVALARESVSREPTVATYWNTLGVAYYRNGQFDDALAALQESMRLGDGGEPVDWFFLAMTQSRRGHASEAVKWFHKGEQYLGSHPPISGEWFQAGAEAAALLGERAPTPPGAK
jgi:serine/threonine protein kinase